MSGRRLRLPDELAEKLSDQLGFVLKSCTLFDAGDETEADRVAVALRVLFHHTNASTSLIHQLNLNQINLLSGLIPDTVPTYNYLINLKLETTPAAVWATPMLGNALAANLVRVGDWWTTEEVCSFDGTPLTRKKLVLSLANKDGAHIDPELDGVDDMIRTFGGFAMQVVEPWEGCGLPAGGESQVRNALRAMVRQIGFEVLNSPVLKPYVLTV
jgi:hypothetical protein